VILTFCYAFCSEFGKEIQGRKPDRLLVNQNTGFGENIEWNLPHLDTCLQPVQKVEINGEVCAETCQKQVSDAYTLRVIAGGTITDRVGLASKFKSSGFEKSTPEAAVGNLVKSDLEDEAKKLLAGIAAKIVLKK
jgi:hypothetical protein